MPESNVDTNFNIKSGGDAQSILKQDSIPDVDIEPRYDAKPNCKCDPVAVIQPFPDGVLNKNTIAVRLQHEIADAFENTDEVTIKDANCHIQSDAQ